MTRTHDRRLNRRTLLKGAAATTAGMLAAPMVVRAENKTIKIGMPTILSGRVAQLGTSSRNAVMMEVDRINGAGGLAGRQIEMVIRDSKGQPQEAARLARELRRHDLIVDLGDESFRLKKSFEASTRAGAKYILIVGENEVKADAFALKNLATGEQISVPRADLPRRIQE